MTAIATDAPGNTPAVLPFNLTGIDYHTPMPRPKVRGKVIDFHSHLLAQRHARDWYATADHYGIDVFFTMTPFDEALPLARSCGDRLHFIAMPDWMDDSVHWLDHWRDRLESFYNIGSRIAKFHMAPQSIARRKLRLDEPPFRPLLDEIVARRMAIMTHIGDPSFWYCTRYTDTAIYGTRDDHYAMWAGLLETYRGTPWIGAHLGGNPEDLHRLQELLDRFDDLYLDSSATKWMVRELSRQRDAARDFIIRNQDRILFGSDQVSGDQRGFDFLASRFWCHRKLWETAHIGPTPIHDPDVAADEPQPTLRGLALPDEVLQKLYHDNAIKLMKRLRIAPPDAASAAVL